MITDNAKSSEIEKVLQHLRQRYADRTGMDELVREIRAKKESIAAQVAEPAAGGKIGQGDFRDAITPIIEGLFVAKLGPPPEESASSGAVWDADALKADFADMLTRAAKLRVELRSNVLASFPNVGPGLRCAARGDFGGLPENPTWHEVLCLAVLIDGYEVARGLTNEHIEVFHRKKEADFKVQGFWFGSAVELWVVLFYYNRMNHWNEGYGFDEGQPCHSLTVSVYQALRLKLMTESETSGLEFEVVK